MDQTQRSSGGRQVSLQSRQKLIQALQVAAKRKLLNNVRRGTHVEGDDNSITRDLNSHILHRHITSVSVRPKNMGKHVHLLTRMPYSEL